MIETIVAAIVQGGAVGGVLVWHLLKTDGRLERLEEAQNRTTRAILLLSLSSPPSRQRREAQSIYDEIVDGAPRSTARDRPLERSLAS